MFKRKDDERFAKKAESASIPRHADQPGTSLANFARILRQAAPFMSAAWVMTTAIVAGGLAGHWLDRRFAWAPWCLLGGLLLGVTVGLWEVARVAFRSKKDRP